MPFINSRGGIKQVEERSNSVWDDYWDQSEKIHLKLLTSICQKNNKVLS
jgi:hypothetical protein